MKWFRDRTELVLAVLLLGSLVLVTPRIAESDAVEYFSYLPSILFDHDVSFEDEYQHFYDEDPEGRQGFKETFLDRSTPTGLKLNFGPMGTAVLWSPFYIARKKPSWLQEPRESNRFKLMSELGETKQDDLIQRVTVARVHRWLERVGFDVVREERHVSGFFVRNFPKFLRRFLERNGFTQNIIISNLELLVKKSS